MILPDKYINYNHSYIKISNDILGIIFKMKDEFTIEDVWKEYKKNLYDVTFSKFYNAYLLLLMMNIITIDKKGVCKCNTK